MTSVRHETTPASVGLRRGFTLVELMVVLVIVVLLSSLTLAGLAGVRNRSKVDKTRTTIRKLNEIILPQYETLLRRRLPLPGGLTAPAQMARERLTRMRTLALYEMPDSWADVAASNGTLPSGNSVPGYAWTATSRGYAAAKAGLPNLTTDNADSECLYLIVTRGCQDPEAIGQFRPDEIGDTDNDGAREFIDAWGIAIGFVRWPAGAYLLSPPSQIQPRDGVNNHDPFDPQRVDIGEGYSLVPMIFSAGPDGLGNMAVTPDSGWTPMRASNQLLSVTGPVWPTPLGGPSDPAFVPAMRDNITNHELSQ